MSQAKENDCTFRGTWQGNDVQIRLLQADEPSSQLKAAFRQWLNQASQLQHPGVLPIIGGCLQLAAVVSPVTKVGLSSMLNHTAC